MPSRQPARCRRYVCPRRRKNLSHGTRRGGDDPDNIAPKGRKTGRYSNSKFVPREIASTNGPTPPNGYTVLAASS
jgi:hypothetical protein